MTGDEAYLSALPDAVYVIGVSVGQMHAATGLAVVQRRDHALPRFDVIHLERFGRVRIVQDDIRARGHTDYYRSSCGPGSTKRPGRRGSENHEAAHQSHHPWGRRSGAVAGLLPRRHGAAHRRDHRHGVRAWRRRLFSPPARADAGAVAKDLPRRRGQRSASARPLRRVHAGQQCQLQGGSRRVMAQAEAAGATITDPARDRFFGGYSGYFQDPDGHLWEVIWNPEFAIEE